MKVEQLIEMLEEMDKDAEVVFVTQENYPMKGTFAALGSYNDMLEETKSEAKNEVVSAYRSWDGEVEVLTVEEQAELAAELEKVESKFVKLDVDRVVIAINENREYADLVESSTWEVGQRD